MTTALARRVEMRAILAAEAEGEALALSVEFGRPRKPHHRSIVGLGVAVNLL
ncbi:MAG TPA: hypothetical protein VIA18_21235 [Polyangia bacterium]|nr:hypothetical protein [Polyangia bacterium]